MRWRLEGESGTKCSPTEHNPKILRILHKYFDTDQVMSLYIMFLVIYGI